MRTEPNTPSPKDHNIPRQTYVIPTLLICFSIMLLFTGCATPYKADGVFGGYSDTQLGPDVFRVKFSGNGYTSSERVQNFAMLRAAELALQHGFTHFAIRDERSGSINHAVTTPGYASTTGSGYISGNQVVYSGTTTYTPGQTINIQWPETGMVVQFFQGKPEGIFSFDAAFVRQSIRKRYGIE